MSYPLAEELVAKAVQEERPISFEYLKGNHYEVRTVSVFEVELSTGTFLGYDHRREGLRRFNLSRVNEAAYADEDYIQPVPQD